MKETLKSSLLAISLLAGTIIGAGVFALPYVFKSAGILTGFFYLALATIVYICVYRMYATVIEKTPGDHRFVGYARIYLGKWTSFLTVLMAIVEMLLVLTIYLILSQSFGNLVSNFGYGTETLIIFWLIGSAWIFLGVRRIAISELAITAGFTVIILIVLWLGLPNLVGNFSGVPLLPSRLTWFLPFAAILFSLSGRQAIPEMFRLAPAAKIKKLIVWGTVAPAVIYGLFVISILAISPSTSPDSVIGLIGHAPNWILIAIGAIGVLTILSSYSTIGLDIYETLELDLKIPHWLRMGIVIFIPLLLYFAGLNSFIGLISLVGGVFLALEGILIIWIWLKATNRRISLPVALLAFIFVMALVYEILK